MHIRFYGHLRAGFGLAGGARATARCLKAAGCQLSYVDLPLASHASVQALSTGSSPVITAPVQVDLVHTNPNILASNPELLERHPLRAPLRIGYWAWELEQFPAGWERFFKDYHEIWCPSSFTAQALAQRSPIPVIATGYSGNLDFMPPDSAELIPWTLQTIERSRGDYVAGAAWAEPDRNRAAEAMRRLALDPAAAQQLGLRGQAIAKERLSRERLSAVVRQRRGASAPGPLLAAARPRSSRRCCSARSHGLNPV